MTRWLRTVCVTSFFAMTMSTGGCGSDGGVRSTGGSGGTGESTSGATGVGGMSGASTMPDPMLVLPIERAGRLVLEFDNVVLTVEPAVGGRVVEFSLDGESILTGPGVNALNYGATFWSSPQSAWSWPPPAALDTQPYTASVEGSTAVARSSEVSFNASDGSGPVRYTVEKRFTPALAARAIDIEYVLTNVGTAPVSIAPWEIARVPAGGLTFFGAGSRYPNSTIVSQDVEGVSWVDYTTAIAAATDPALPKLFADGSGGWLAHVAGSLLFVAAFDEVPAAAQAPGEGEIEVFLGPNYAEVEHQGAYGPLAPGASVVHRVRWYLRRLDPGTPATVGSAALVASVRALLGP